MNTAGFIITMLSVLPMVQTVDRIPSHVREHVMRRVEEGYCVGLVVGVVDAEGVTYFSRGRVSKDNDRPVNEETIFEIGSITKAFTGILLADMVERGEVALDDPVRKHLPSTARVPSSGDKDISLRDLAYHHSGLPRLPDNLEPSDWENPYADYKVTHLLKFLGEHTLTREVGSKYEYSNLGAGLLGYALSNSANKSFEQLIVERICEPLGMKDTRIALIADQRSRLARGYAGDEPAKNWDLDALAGAGALRSTARDMVRFLGANLEFTSSPLSPALRAVLRERFPTNEPDLSVALGWHIWTKHGSTIVWHNGGTGGYRSFAGFNPDKKIGVVVLTNSVEDVEDIGLHLLEPKYELKQLRRAATVTGALLDAYLGYYEVRPGVTFHITREDDQLFAQLIGQDKAPVFPESETRFFYKIMDAQLTFVRGDDGEVNHLILHQHGDHKARKLAPDYQPPVRTEVHVDPAILARYAGKYELAKGVEFDVMVEDDQLKVKLSGQPRFPVYPESETKFFYKVVEAQLTFVVDEAGTVTGLILHQGGLNQHAKRME